jgi:hypothetical protein
MYKVTINFPFDCNMVWFESYSKAIDYFCDVTTNYMGFDEEITSIVMRRADDVVAFFKPELDNA